MDTPELPRVNDTFDTLVQVKERVVAAVFPHTGFTIICNHIKDRSTAYFYCRSGRLISDKDKVPRCEFRVKAFRVNDEWRIEEVNNGHNHGKSKKLERNPNYTPAGVGASAKIIKDMREKGTFRLSFLALLSERIRESRLTLL